MQEAEYRPCRNRQAAYALETRLIAELDSLCRVSRANRVKHYHGKNWSAFDRQAKVNHVAGHCKLPGGVCDPEHIRAMILASAPGKGAHGLAV